jgi:peptide deformylase
LKKVINCLKESNPLINKKLREVSVEEGNSIATELFQILNKRGDGIGLAANQVGIDAQVAVEGCLSYPKKGVNTKRYETIEVTSDNVEGSMIFSGVETSTEGKGSWEKSDDSDRNLRLLESVCVQHEIDHLNGIICMDRRIETSYVRSEKKIGRNELVTIKRGDAVKVLKYKKAQKFINDGWEIE